MFTLPCPLRAALFLALALFAAPLPSLAQDYNPQPTTHKFPYAGATLGMHDRLEKVSGHKFLDFDENPIDAIILIQTPKASTTTKTISPSVS